MNEMRGLLASGTREKYALGGHATITTENPATGNRFTFKIDVASCECVQKLESWGRKGAAKKDCTLCNGSGRKTGLYFVKVLVGPDNQNSYAYIGLLDKGAFMLTKNSKFDDAAPSVRAFAWVAKHWESDEMNVWHEGSCGICGRKLTVPESISSGIGPVCAAGGLLMFKVEVIADNSGQWVGNSLTFDSREAAEAYGVDLFSRWTAVREWRVVEVAQ